MKRKLAGLCIFLLAQLSQTSVLSREAKIRVVLDTDTFNEMDDQFFVTYVLLEPRFEIEGICATQYRVTEASVDESYYEARRILDLMGKSSKIPLFMGSENALPDPKTPRRSPASRFISERALARESRPLYILAVGALTNVASAYLETPSMRGRVRLIWLGGSSWPEGALTEFNAVNDRAAVKCMVEAGFDFTQIPTETCAKQLTTTYSEAETRLRHRNAVANYLLDLYRDYGANQKVIWDMTAVACLLQQALGKQFFQIETVRAPFVDASTLQYTANPNGAPMKVCTRLEREEIFRDFYARFPAPEDFDPPYVTLASSRGDSRSVSVTFNERADPDSAQNSSNYRVEPGVHVQSAKLVDGSTVQLNLDTSLDRTKSYQLICSGIRDLSARRNLIGPRNSYRFKPEPQLRDGLQATLYDVGPHVRDFPSAELLGGFPRYQDRIREPWFVLDNSYLLKHGLRHNFNVILDGLLEVPFNHAYEFSCYADDALRMEIDGRTVLDTDRIKGILRVSSQVELPKGLHPVRISFLQREGGYFLNLYWNFPFHEKQRIPWNYWCSASR